MHRDDARRDVGISNKKKTLESGEYSIRYPSMNAMVAAENYKARTGLLLMEVPGAIITLRSGSKYEVQNDGSWRRIKDGPVKKAAATKTS